MATIASLNVAITAKTRAFEKGLKKAQKILRNFGGQIKSIVGKIVNMKTAILGLAGAGGFGVLIKRSLEAIDTMVKFSDILGFSVEEMSKLEHAAALSGVSVQQLRKGLQMMTSNIQDAADGIGVAKTALEDLGIDAQKLAAMRPEDQFLIMADAIENLDSQTKKVQIGKNLFGARGIGLLKIMQGGADTVKAMADEAERLGLVITRVDAAKIEMANDAFTNLQFVLGRIVDKFTVELAPVLKIISDETTAWVKSLDITGFFPKMPGLSRDRFLFGAVGKIYKKDSPPHPL